MTFNLALLGSVPDLKDKVSLEAIVQQEPNPQGRIERRRWNYQHEHIPQVILEKTLLAFGIPSQPMTEQDRLARAWVVRVLRAAFDDLLTGSARDPNSLLLRFFNIVCRDASPCYKYQSSKGAEVTPYRLKVWHRHSSYRNPAIDDLRDSTFEYWLPQLNRRLTAGNIDAVTPTQGRVFFDQFMSFFLAGTNAMQWLYDITMGAAAGRAFGVDPYFAKLCKMIGNNLRWVFMYHEHLQSKSWQSTLVFQTVMTVLEVNPGEWSSCELCGMHMPCVKTREYWNGVQREVGMQCDNCSTEHNSDSTCRGCDMGTCQHVGKYQSMPLFPLQAGFGQYTIGLNNDNVFYAGDQPILETAVTTVVQESKIIPVTGGEQVEMFTTQVCPF